MKEFYWKIAGADLSLLIETKDESQSRFKLIGKIISFVYIFIFISFFIFTYHAFQNGLMALFISLLIAFLIGNIYQINLLSLEPNSLPRKKEAGSVVLAYIIRYGTIGLFGVFVSKILEAIFYYYVILDFKELNLKSLALEKFQNNSEFVHQLLELNKNHPEIWIFTIAISLFFCSPIFLKYKFKKDLEYYRFKRERDIAIAKKEHIEYKTILRSLYISLYKKHNGIKVFEEHPIKFLDEPFNTKKIENLTIYKSSTDFSNLFN